MINNFNINQLGYNLYDEYLQRYYENALKYSKFSGLSIRYYHINLDASQNYDEETGIQISMKEFVFDIYEFIPVIEMNPPTNQVTFDPTEQGTSYLTTITLTIVGIQNPLPGDLFHFYPTENASVDDTEVYRVKRVNYIRSINKKYFIYQIDAELAPIKRDNLDKVKVLNHFYYNFDLGNYFIESKLSYYQYLVEKLNDINYFSNLLDKVYDNVKARIVFCKLNSVINFLQNYQINFKTIDYNDYLYQGIDDLKDFSVSEFMYSFDKYIKFLNVNPITGLPLVQEIIQSVENNDENIFNDLTLVNENSEDDSNNDTINNLSEEDYIFSDYACIEVEKYLQNQEEINNYEIFKIKYSENTVEKNEEFFDIYYEIYKVLYCLRELDPNFYNLLNFEKENIINFINDTHIFYNIEGALSQDYYLKNININYDPGYYLSYQDGASYFEPLDNQDIL